jgi:transposase
VHSTVVASPVLSLAFELGWTTWKLAVPVGLGPKPRLRTIPARSLTSLAIAIRTAKARFGLSEDAPVVRCSEAGRDGFWLHRYLAHEGIGTLIVDSARIEVNRRKRRAQSDRLDAAKLVTMLIRWHLGDRKVWCTVNVPSPEDEDGRQFPRGLIDRKAERTRHRHRIQGLLAGVGLSILVDAKRVARLSLLRPWDGPPVPEHLQQRILGEFARWKRVDRPIRDRDNQRARAVRRPDQPEVEKVRRLMRLKGVASTGAWIRVREFFAGRQFRNRRELGGRAGLTPTPDSSGDTQQEPGISKAGNQRVRWLMIELAWGWLRYQPESGLSRWYQERFGQGNSRMRRIGIVALARKLRIAFGRYLEFDEVPAGAELVELEEKLTTRRRAVRPAS